jgi:hypothetical protein
MIYPRRSPILASRVGKPIPTDLAAWYRYNTGITSSGGTVSAWANQTGGEALVQATAANQPVNGTPGANLAVNGTFDSDTGWTTPSGWSIGSGVASKSPGVAGFIRQALSGADEGSIYLITYTVSNYVAGGINSRITGSATVNAPGRAANGTYTDVLVAPAGTTYDWGLFAGSTFEGSIDNVSIQKITADGTIYFDGISHFLKTAPFTLNQPTTVYFLGRQVTWTQNHTLFDGNTSTVGRVYQNGSTPQLSAQAGASLIGPISPALGSYGVICAVFNGANSVFQLDNGTPVTGTVGAGNMGAFTLGARGDTALPANMQAKEALIYNAAHDANQRAAVIAYLNMVNQL